MVRDDDWYDNPPDDEADDAYDVSVYKQGLACFEGNAPSYHMELKEHPVMVWNFLSLMMAVKFLFSLKLTDPEQPMKMCEYCQKAFIARRPDTRFCSVSCRDKHKRE